MMGYSAATAATVAGSLAVVFGSTGAGLAGYKMLKRTRGLTDFEFQQYDDKVSALKNEPNTVLLYVYVDRRDIVILYIMMNDCVCFS